METNRIEFQRGKKLLQDCWMMDQKVTHALVIIIAIKSSYLWQKRPRVDKVRNELESIYQAGKEIGIHRVIWIELQDPQ